MKNIDYKNFTSDILKLYCKTQNKEIETLFVKMASVEVNLFYKWLLKNKKLKNKMSNPSTYDALELLSQIRSVFSYGEPLEKSTIVKTLHENARTLAAIPIIIGMKKFLDAPATKEILQPYRDIVETVSTLFTSKDIDYASVENDLTVVKNEYFVGADVESPEEVKKKESIPQQKKNMFQYLLIKFSEEIANAASSSGLTDLANTIKDGALSKPAPVSLSEFINFNPASQDQIDLAKKLADFVAKNYDSRLDDYNHDIVQITLLGKAGQLTPEDIQQLKFNYEKQKNIVKYVEEPGTKFPGIDPMDKITFDKRLNPDYLLMLSSFFVILQSKVGMPSSFGF